MKTFNEAYDYLTAAKGNDVEIQRRGEVLAADAGQRMPTVTEVVRAYSTLLKNAGISEEEGIILTLEAARITRDIMKKNDAKLSVTESSPSDLEVSIG